MNSYLVQIINSQAALGGVYDRVSKCAKRVGNIAIRFLNKLRAPARESLS